MYESRTRIDRRQFTVAAAATAAAFVVPLPLRAKADVTRRYKYCAFIKFLQSLNYEELADQIAEAGFDGVEATCRKDGYIDPARAADELPRLHEALKKRNLEIMILTTDVVRADQPHVEAMLRAAAGIGVPRYRLGFYRYDLKKPILPQVADLKPIFRDIAALNREMNIAALYQNHAGADFMGATIWDLHRLIKDYPLDEISCVFDIRHAAVEGGEAWPVYFNLMQPYFGAVSVKDYRWDGLKSKHVPLGKGRVDPQFFQLLRQSSFDGPISVHVEYDGDLGAKANLAALKTDFATLRKWMNS